MYAGCLQHRTADSGQPAEPACIWQTTDGPRLRTAGGDLAKCPQVTVDLLSLFFGRKEKGQPFILTMNTGIEKLPAGAEKDHPRIDKLLPLHPGNDPDYRIFK